MINRLAVIGVGLIGGSLSRALRVAGEVGEVVGCGRSAANLERAVALGVIDRFSHDPAQAVMGADMVFIAVPLGAMRQTFSAIKDHLLADAVVTDADIDGSEPRFSFGDRQCAAILGAEVGGDVVQADFGKFALAARDAHDFRSTRSQ